MLMLTMYRASRLAAAVVFALATVNTIAHGQPGRSAPVKRLERARAASPGSVGVLRALGVAYHQAGRHAEALAVLTEARRLAPRDGVVALYTGLSAEATGDLTTARDAYSSYIAHGRTRRVRHQLASRLAALNRRELARTASEAVARETALGAAPAAPGTVAVPPFTFSGSDSTLAPLERGLADLVITDLSRSAALTLVERDRLQALLDEIDRSGSGIADSATRLRAGRLIRAGRLVQGAITQLPGGALRVDAAIIDVPTTTAVDAVSEDDRLEQLLVLEKRIVFSLFDALGVILTPAERALVEQRPTRSMAAFVSYSAGLASADSGHFAAAAGHFAEAQRLDPDFAAARERGEEARAASEGESLTTAAIEAALAGSEREIAHAAARGLAFDAAALRATMAMTLESINPSPLLEAAGGTLIGQLPPLREAASSVTNTDSPISGLGTIIIIIRTPIQ